MPRRFHARAAVEALALVAAILLVATVTLGTKVAAFAALLARATP